jgi:type VI secretion system protein ImpL
MTVSTGISLAALMPYVIALLAVIALGLAFLSVRHAREAKANGRSGGAGPDLPEAGVLERLPSRSLPQSIKLASVQLQRLVTGGSGIYEVPWVVAVGAGGHELDGLLPAQLPWPPDLAGAHQAILSEAARLSFCRAGAVLSFDDGLLDGPGRSHRWHRLIRALLTCRPERPIDGLVVVVHASELADSSQAQDRRVAQGEQLYDLIWSAQRLTGWRIPVYLLITGCEELAGFADWVLALPRQARQQVLGWSVPYALDSVFEPRWVDEGFAEIARQLSIAQLVLMMPEPETAVAEGLLLFPGEVERLASALSALLTSMLRTSAYHEAFMFRGFFLAGRVPETAVQQSRRDAFAEALFSNKVFPEHKLAQPAYGETTRRHRRLRVAQAALSAAAIVALIGLLHIRTVKTDDFPAVTTLLSRIDQLVSAAVLRTNDFRFGPGHRERVRDEALALINAMAAIHINRIDTIAAPTSLLTSANTQVAQAISAGYSVAVLDAAYQALTEEPSLVAIIEPELPPSAPIPTAPQALAATIDNILQYDKYIRIYQGIGARPSIGDVAALMGYALNVQLPADFTTDYQLYEYALSNTQMRRIDTTKLQPIVERRLQDRYDAAVRDAYSNSPLVVSIKKLTRLAGNLTTPQGVAAATAGRQTLADTQATLDTIAGLLAPPQAAWLTGTPNSSPFATGLDKLRPVEVVRRDFIDGLRAGGLKAEADTRTWVLQAAVFANAPILAATDKAVTLSPAMEASRRLLSDLFSQPFMQPAPVGSTAISALPGSTVSWDEKTLSEAETIAESFLAFVPKQTGRPPATIEQQVRSIAGASAAANITQLLRLAARPVAQSPNGGSQATLQDAAGMASVLPLLLNLRNALRQAGAADEAGALDRLVSGEAVRLLRQLSDDLVSAAPYRLADPSLSFWRGAPPLAEPAFGATSPTELASTLPPRRDFIETLAREYAAPLVRYLRDPGTRATVGAAALVTQWQSILDSLDRYHRSDPSNSLTRLEQFITVDMDKIDLSNCRQLTVGGGTGGDYFAEQLRNIRQAIASRCVSVVRTDTRGRYANLSARFNSKLAGRFPFSSLAASSAPASPSLGAAEPSNVRGFFAEFGPDLAALQAQFQTAGTYGADSPGIAPFLADLVAVQTAFAPMLSDPSGHTPLSYQVDVSFFTNPAAGRGQNQVLDAAIIVGTQRASSMNGTSRIVWTNGDSLRVRLRWAANAPMVPDGSARSQWPRITGLDADFAFADNWALLRLIAIQTPNAPDLNALQDRTPEVVAFDVPLRRNPNAAIGGNSEVDTARVYLRLALTGIAQAPGQPQKTTPVVLPQFPTAAPLLEQTAFVTDPAVNTGPIGLAAPAVGSVSP